MLAEGTVEHCGRWRKQQAPWVWRTRRELVDRSWLGSLAIERLEHLPQAKRLKSGMIQLQLHDPGMIVHFKDLQLKVLK